MYELRSKKKDCQVPGYPLDCYDYQRYSAVLTNPHFIAMLSFVFGLSPCVFGKKMDLAIRGILP